MSYSIACVQPLLRLIRNRLCLRGGSGCTRAIWGTIRWKLHFGGGREGLKTAVLHDTILLAWFLGQACYSPYPLSGGSFSLKENGQIKTLAQTFLRQSLPNAQGPNTWLTLVLSIRWNRSELFNNDYINNIYFVFNRQNEVGQTEFAGWARMGTVRLKRFDF